MSSTIPNSRGWHWPRPDPFRSSYSAGFTGQIVRTPRDDGRRRMQQVGFVEAISRRNPRLSQEWNLSPDRLGESPREHPAKRRRRSSEISYIDLMDATQVEIPVPPSPNENQGCPPAAPPTPNEGNNCIECAICLCPAEPGSIVGTLHVGPSSAEPSCPHRFCFDCIFKWSKATNLCPLCKGRFGCIRKHKVVRGNITRAIEGPLGLVRVKKKDMRPEDFVTPPGEDGELRQLYNDLVCEVCREGTAENALLICEMCDRGYHTFCLRPRLTSVPLDDWFCPECQQAMLESVTTSPPPRRSLRLQRRSTSRSNTPTECSSSSTSSSSSSSITGRQSPVAHRTRSSMGRAIQPQHERRRLRRGLRESVASEESCGGFSVENFVRSHLRRQSGRASALRLSQSSRPIVLDATQPETLERGGRRDRDRVSVWEEAISDSDSSRSGRDPDRNEGWTDSVLRDHMLKRNLRFTGGSC